MGVTQDEALYGIEELAELGGVSRRTVRYYVQRGLIPAPKGTGRGKHYTQGHLDTLIKVRQLQEQGVSLDEIVARLSGGSAPSGAEAERGELPSELGGELWVRLVVAEGVELHVSQRWVEQRASQPGGMEGLVEELRRLLLGRVAKA
jgi:DNA-binding transcriptional MerR regulator